MPKTFSFRLYNFIADYWPAFIVCSLIFLLLILPDIIFSRLYHTLSVSSDFFSFGFMVAFAVFFLISRNRKLVKWFVFFLAIIQFAQFCHIKYFGTIITPASIYIMTKEVRDVCGEARNVFWEYVALLPMVILAFYGVYKLSFLRVVQHYKTKGIYPIILFALGLTYMRHGVPNGIFFSLENSLRAVIGYVYLLIDTPNFKIYRPYTVEKIMEVKGPITIVYIVGESFNADHMSLFGYLENTTPELDKLARLPNFYYTRGISSAVTTYSACKFIFNAIKEPDNANETALETTNLFRLAKLGGFKTFYISAQRADLISIIGGVSYIDTIITRGLYPMQFAKKKDSFLLELLSQQEFGNKNFIVIHQRCIHSPYTTAIPSEFGSPQKFSRNTNSKINEYNNAVLFNDYVISNIFNMFNRTKGKYYIIFASDHNELMGKNGLWGHSFLNKEVAQIPIMIQSNDVDFMQRIKNVFKITHYDICCAIAYLLGFKINNPNENMRENGASIYYVNGVDYLGRCGYIKFRKDYKNRKIEYLN